MALAGSSRFAALDDALARTDLAVFPTALRLNASFAAPSNSAVLTLPRVNSTGAVWTSSQLHVSSGFEAEFRFRISSPSSTCPDPWDTSPYCAARGGHGLAFVLHNHPDGPAAIGLGGEGLGYEGLENSLAVEFDSWYDSGLQDLYDNHIAVQSRGKELPNSSHHRFALGSSSGIADLANGQEHVVRLLYDPVFDETLIHPELCVASQSCGLLQATASLSRYGRDEGLGVFSVHMDGAMVLAIPMRLDALLALNGGNATLGFTASTGDRQWQVHEVSGFVVCTHTSYLPLPGAVTAFGTEPPAPPPPLDRQDPECLRIIH